jgi:hypothetical protein
MGKAIENILANSQISEIQVRFELSFDLNFFDHASSIQGTLDLNAAPSEMDGLCLRPSLGFGSDR